MCGIAGIVATDRVAPEDEARAVAMRDVMSYRGPDGAGLHTDAQAVLAHRRLSIIDLAGGHQPLSNETGAIWVTYNGEIYNHRDVRAQLETAGHTYRTSLDHVGFGLPGGSLGRGAVLGRRREVAGVTAACMLTPFAAFDAVGGLTTLLPGNYNDVDYCMKLRMAGWAIVYEPAATLYHFESQSRVAGINPDEIELIQQRWLTHLVDDPFTPAHV